MQTIDRQFIRRLSVDTRGREMRDVTAAVASALREEGAGTGLLTLFIRHTSASLTIQENADPDVRADLLDAFNRLAPADADYRHTIEGPDDMPAHIKTVISGVHLSIPVLDGDLMLGTWQGIYVVEHRASPHRREIVLHFAGRAGEG